MKFDKETITSMVKAYLAEADEEYDAEERELELINIIGDKYFTEAVTLCVENNLCNTVFLQREMNVGYGKAIAIIHAMEALKLIEPFYITGNRSRKVLPAANEFLSHLEQKTFET